MAVRYYLITGGAGFIGANFIKYMLDKYNDTIELVILDKLTYAGNLGTIAAETERSNVHFIKGDIADKKIVNTIFATYPIDFVVNFAAESHVDRSIENPQLFLETNILGTQNLLHCTKQAWYVGQDTKGYPTYKTGKKFLQVSTDEVYGSLSKDFEIAQPFSIGDRSVLQSVNRSEVIKTYGSCFFTENTPLDPRSPYSASKAGADMIVKAYFDTFKLPVNITRCSNNYGPYHFPEKLIPLIIKNILAGQSLPVYGAGENVRDWLYVTDHAKAIDMVLHGGCEGEVYNIGGYNEERNIDIVKITIDTVIRLMKQEPRYQAVLTTPLDSINYDLIKYVGDRLGHDMRYAIDPSKIVTELGWFPETPFAEGIEKTVRWNLENQDWVEDVTSGDYQKYYEQMYTNR